jgi:hypothetical protein
MKSYCCQSYSAVKYLCPWGRVILGNIMVPQLVKKFPAFCETRRFTAVFTAALKYARLIQSTPTFFPKNPFENYPSVYSYVFRFTTREFI